MSDMMTFPDTWEEFEKLYGFNDGEEIYTNNSRLIPSFRVKQWLDHLPSVQPERKRGQWIRNDNGTYSCSICQSWIPEEQHHYARYCLYCAADMRGEQDD